MLGNRSPVCPLHAMISLASHWVTVRLSIQGPPATQFSLNYSNAVYAFQAACTIDIHWDLYGDRSKGPCNKEFWLRTPCMLCWKPSRQFFFRARESNIFFRESFAKVGYYNHYVKGCGHPLPPGVRQEKGTVLVHFPVWWCLWTITPFIGSSRASKGEASRQPNAMVLKHILAPAAVTA